MNNLKRELIAAHPPIAPIINNIPDDHLDTLVQTIIAHITKVPSLVECHAAWLRIERANDITIVSNVGVNKPQAPTQSTKRVYTRLTSTEKRNRQRKLKLTRRQEKLALLQRELVELRDQLS